MGKHELKKLSRAQLLEMLLEQSKEVEKLQDELAEANLQLQNRRICMEKAGNIAEAALQLNGVFAAAQAAADEYLAGVTDSVQATRKQCRLIEEETKRKCEQMLRLAQAESAAYWDALRNRILNSKLDAKSRTQLLESLEDKPKQVSK